MAAGTLEAVAIVLGVAAAGGLITWGVCTARMANRDPDLFEPREGWGDWPAVPCDVGNVAAARDAGRQGANEAAASTQQTMSLTHRNTVDKL